MSDNKELDLTVETNNATLRVEPSVLYPEGGLYLNINEHPGMLSHAGRFAAIHLNQAKAELIRDQISTILEPPPEPALPDDCNACIDVDGDMWARSTAPADYDRWFCVVNGGTVTQTFDGDEGYTLDELDDSYGPLAALGVVE